MEKIDSQKKWLINKIPQIEQLDTTKAKVTSIIAPEKIIKIPENKTPLEIFEYLKRLSNKNIFLCPFVEYIEKWTQMNQEERNNVLRILNISFLKFINLASQIKNELKELEDMTWENIGDIVPLEEIAQSEELLDWEITTEEIIQEKISEDEEIIEKRRKDVQEKEERKQRKIDNQRITNEISQIEKLIKEGNNQEAFLIAKTLEEEFPRNKKVKEIAAKCRKLVKG